MCPPVSPCKGASIVHSPRPMRVFLHGNAATRTFGRAHRRRPYAFRLGGLCVERLVSFRQIACKWLFCLCGIVRKCITEIGRGGACVPARVAPQGRIHRSSPAHHACIFGMETPLRGRSGGHTGTAPTVSFGWIACGRLILFGWITRKWIMEFGRSGYRCTHLFYPVKGTFHYFLKNRLARWMASLNWRGLM